MGVDFFGFETDHLLGESATRPSEESRFNILAPGVITKHVTLGGSYALSPKTDLSFSYMYAPSDSVSGGPSNFGGGTEIIKMSQQALGIQYGWRW